ncbi:SPFH domain-containing protein [Phaeacidiphilus oryzae]|uniref:hypothetical protein n=1 Tax=Phaeacidiphilus oryzae TaxID=348818 RepID=UPI00055DD728|nr:hypothetical protein [Phaeacidiphilus oryzae]
MGWPDWGDVPTWGATLFAGVAAWAAYRTLISQRNQIGEQREFIDEQAELMRRQSEVLELQRAELAADAEERRMAQARMIEMKASRIGSGNARNWSVSVANRSDQPIYDVMVKFGSAYLAAGWIAHETDRPALTSGPMATLGPRRPVVFKSSRMDQSTLDISHPVAYFTDAGGRRWALDEHGTLSESSEPIG